MSDETKVQSNILDDKKFWLICPKCKNFPLITPNINFETKEVSIILKCRCNKYKEEQYSIEDYFNQTTQKLKKKMSCTKNPTHSSYLAVNYCFQCQEFLCSLCRTIHDTLNKDHIISDEAIKIDKICDRHLKENEIVSYCNECNMNLCTTCLKEHNIHHEIYEVRNFFPKNLIDKYFEDFKLIQVTFFKYINEAKKVFDEKIKEAKDDDNLEKKVSLGNSGICPASKDSRTFSTHWTNALVATYGFFFVTTVPRPLLEVPGQPVLQIHRCQDNALQRESPLRKCRIELLFLFHLAGEMPIAVPNFCSSLFPFFQLVSKCPHYLPHFW